MTQHTTQDSQSELEKLVSDIELLSNTAFYDFETTEEVKRMIEAYVTTRVKEAVVAVQQDLDDMSRFIAALLIQSGGVVTVTKRTLMDIPVPSKINFERLDNIDGSITMVLESDKALTTTTNGKEE